MYWWPIQDIMLKILLIQVVSSAVTRLRDNVWKSVCGAHLSKHKCVRVLQICAYRHSFSEFTELSVQKKNFPLKSCTAMTAKMNMKSWYTMRMLNTFFRDVTTQSKTAFKRERERERHGSLSVVCTQKDIKTICAFTFPPWVLEVFWWFWEAAGLLELWGTLSSWCLCLCCSC